jgi:hypothetical protein
MAEAAALTPARKRWTLVAVILGSGIVFLDTSVVNLALPRIGEELIITGDRHILDLSSGVVPRVKPETTAHPPLNLLEFTVTLEPALCPCPERAA